MIRTQRSHVIDASTDAIWAELSRYMHIDEICEGITHVDALSVGDNGVGSKRRNHFAGGNGSMVEEVTEWTVNRGYKLRMREMTSFPAKEATAFITLEPVGSKTRVTWGMDYRMKFGPLGWLMGQTMLKRMMGKVIDSNLQGLANKVRANGTVTSIRSDAKSA